MRHKYPAFVYPNTTRIAWVQVLGKGVLIICAKKALDSCPCLPAGLFGNPPKKLATTQDFGLFRSRKVCDAMLWNEMNGNLIASRSVL